MPPKKAPAPSKKTELKKKEKVIEQVEKQVKPGSKKDDPKKLDKEKKLKEQQELALLFKPVQTQKVDKGTDPKSVVCAFFKQGQCTKGDKCKFSHDLTVERKAEKRSLYCDMRDDDKETDTMDKWDEDKLKEVVEKNTEVEICKHFLEAVEKSKYGWFWECPSKAKCIYRHALPPGFVLKKDKKKEDKKDEISLEDLIERERANLGPNQTRITLETFLAWKKRKLREKKEKAEKDEEKKRSDFKAGRQVGISGREMFSFNPELAAGDGIDDGDEAIDSYALHEEDAENIEYRELDMDQLALEAKDDLEGLEDELGDLDMEDSTPKVKLNGVKNGVAVKNITAKKSEIRRLFSLAKPEKWKLTGAITLLLISSTVTMAVPFCLGKIIDVIYTEDTDKMRENLKKISLLLLGVFIIGGICNFGRIYFMSTSGHRITQSLRDAQLVSAAVTSNISDGLRSSIMSLAGVSMMFYVSPQLACVGLAIVPPITGLAIVYGRFVKKISKDVQNSLAILATTAEEKISNIRTVKAFAQENNEIKRYSSKLDDLLNLCYKESFYRGIFFGLTGLTGNAIILSVLYYGGVMMSESTITVGNLSAFLLYAAYTGISLSGISNFYTELNRALGASTRLFEFIDRVPKIPIEGGIILDSPLSGDIKFDNICFKYPTRDDCWILNNFSLNLSAGSVNAIVGPSGSGKSTVALLLLRLYDPNSGDILLDNHNIKELNPSWVKSQIGFVSQEPILFNGTIKENIRYGSNDASDEDIMDAAKLANVLEFSRRMTEGLDTVVGERGVTLSGGQRQRNPKILVLDEATSALDAESENYVQEALERATQGRTVLTIAHRLSTIKNSDKIAVINKGKIVETGNYNELMLINNGLFKKLVQHQTFK
ncbi:hypothetical protein G9C98_004899 [Cotesia typhae]|uniref:Zinc finger CCCH domain-containing protein 15 n=2 Tax=Braconidae TaxID=7402 RepID=A0A8J5RBL8_9HYME|nr:hypothetical protein G9C98_004899 [Cotesia typhae]